ncbi:hypothetical protein KAW50_02590 [candidate division WOR-3 bacterium]|nr:hypothetical protein [candidate division WOR-3 bacterium]
MEEAAKKAKLDLGKKEGDEQTVGSEDLKKAMDEKDMQIEGLEGKIDSLQDSLDSALEEMALKGGVPPIEEEPISPLIKEGAEDEVTKTETPPLKTETETVKPEKETTPSKESGSNIESKLEEAIEEDRQFRDGVLLREEVRDLKDEMKDVLELYPEANREEILRDVEDGIEEDNPNQVEVLAKTSAERRQKLVEDTKTKYEEELRAKLTKEQEGGISVPQSPGAPTAPKVTPQTEGQETHSPIREDVLWGDALHKAKEKFVEGGGV